jgi:hypothetical protein
MKKSKTIGKIRVDGKIVDIVSLNHTLKNQPRDNKGRFLHVERKTHIDDWDKKDKKGNPFHLWDVELKTISLHDCPKTIPTPWKYNNFALGWYLGVPIGTIEIFPHVGSITINAQPQAGVIAVGSPSY